MSESYLIGGNKFQDLGGSKYGAQTFMPLDTHVLQYIDLELDSTIEGLHPGVKVYFSDAFGNPVPPALSWSRGATPSPRGYRVPYRCRVDMREYRLTRAVSYVMAVHSGDAPHPWSLRWQYDKDVAAYPRGIRLHSGDHGQTWSPDPNDDHMFAEFGNPPLYRVPHNPPPLYWALVYIAEAHYSTSACFRFGTSSPVTMTLHVTGDKPKPMETFRVTRGYKHRCLEYYAFNSWRHYLQKEKGDSLYHTFHVAGLKEGERYWMVNTAESDTNPSLSISPLLVRTHPEGPPFTTIRRPDAPGDLCSWRLDGNGPPCPDHYQTINEAAYDDEASQLVGVTPNRWWYHDLYNIPDYGAEERPIDEVHITGRFKRTGGYSYVQVFRLIVKTHGVQYTVSSTMSSPEFYKNYHVHLKTNPFTEEPWTAQEVNNLQIGVGLRHTWSVGWSSTGFCTQLFCTIKHKCEKYG